MTTASGITAVWHRRCVNQGAPVGRDCSSMLAHGDIRPCLASTHHVMKTVALWLVPISAG